MFRQCHLYLELREPIYEAVIERVMSSDSDILHHIKISDFVALLLCLLVKKSYNIFYKM